MFGWYFDPLYMAMTVPCMLLALWAQYRVKSAFARYSKVRNSSQMSGAEAALNMLHREGVRDCRVEMTSGWLSDHYDPTNKVLRLSPDVYNGRTVAAVGIACHEAGHALQHAESYGFLTLRTMMVPVASLGSSFAFILIFIGSIIHALSLAKLGVFLFAGVVLFQIITLPVEFNASSRAKRALYNNGIISLPEEVSGVNAVLNAAAMTYVAATIAALMQLLYYAIRLGLLGNNNDD